MLASLRVVGHVQESLARKQAELEQLKQQIEQLVAERAASAQQLAALQQEADRAVAGGGGVAPAYDHGDIDMAEGDEQQPANGNAVNTAQLTIQEIKEWLTDQGFEEEVWALTSRKAPRVKKDDWVQLVRSKQGAARC
jgi:hypothetical protein